MKLFQLYPEALAHLACKSPTVTLKERRQAIEGIGTGLSAFNVHEALGVKPVSIDEAGIEHLHPKPNLEIAILTQEIRQKRPHVFRRFRLYTLRFLRFAEMGS